MRRYFADFQFSQVVSVPINRDYRDFTLMVKWTTKDKGNTIHKYLNASTIMNASELGGGIA